MGKLSTIELNYYMIIDFKNQVEKLPKIEITSKFFYISSNILSNTLLFSNF